jgi:hypothetical protein
VDWVLDATGVYASPGLTRTAAYVFAASDSGSAPFVYFARDPSAVPFWATGVPAGTESRAEFFANAYTAGKAGQFTWRIERVGGGDVRVPPRSRGRAVADRRAAGQELIQVTATGDARGPNGGYVPFAYDVSERGVPMRITWTFDPTGSGPGEGPVSGSQTFTPLSGPDGDGDGVSDATDRCAGVAGTGPDGCPAPPPDPDGDGVFGDDDRCPQAAAPGVPGGCPPAPPPASGGGGPAAGGGGTPPSTAPPAASTAGRALVATLATRPGTRLRAAALRRGVPVRVTCSAAATAKVSLIVGATVGRRLGLRPVGRTATVASRSAACTPGRALTVTLRPARRTTSRIARLRKPLAATLGASLSAPGATTGGARVAVRLG